MPQYDNINPAIALIADASVYEIYGILAKGISRRERTRINDVASERITDDKTEKMDTSRINTHIIITRGIIAKIPVAMADINDMPIFIGVLKRLI